jgi:hypothetical protein
MLIKGLFGAVPHRLLKPDDDGAGGAGGGGSGGTGGDNGEGGNGGGDNTGTVDLKTHKAILDKYHAQNADTKKKEAEIERLRNELKSKSNQDSTDKGDFKSLYERTKADNETLQAKFTEYRDAAVNTRRGEALEAELKKLGLKAGNESVIDFADFEEMPHELTSRGRILVHGVEEAARKLKEKYSFAFETKTTPRINSGGAGGGSGNNGAGAGDGTEFTDDQLTTDFMLEMEKKDRAMYRKLMPRYSRIMASKR